MVNLQGPHWGRGLIILFSQGAVKSNQILDMHMVKGCLMHIVSLSLKEQDLELEDPGSDSGSPRN